MRLLGPSVGRVELSWALQAGNGQRKRGHERIVADDGSSIDGRTRDRIR